MVGFGIGLRSLDVRVDWGEWKLCRCIMAQYELGTTWNLHFFQFSARYNSIVYSILRSTDILTTPG